jgi:hypothetical protein
MGVVSVVCGCGGAGKMCNLIRQKHDVFQKYYPERCQVRIVPSRLRTQLPYMHQAGPGTKRVQDVF